MNMNSSSSAAAAVSSNSASVTSNVNDDAAPLWSYVMRSEKIGEGGGSVPWECSFCHTGKTTTYTRVKAHLLRLKGRGIAGCKAVTSQDIAEMQKLENEAEKRKESEARARNVPLPPSNVTGSISERLYGNKKRKDLAGNPSTGLEKAFNTQGRNMLHAHIARFFYASGLPFHLARSPYYAACFSYAAENNLKGYTPPGYNLLRTSLLQQEKANVMRLLEPIKSTWKEKGISIVSDGWSDSQRRPLINFMAVTESGPMFIKVVDCLGEVKDKQFIYRLMKEVIEEVGPENVVQVITDNARNCAGAGALIEGVYLNITWTPCVVHTLNLALQNICAAKNIVDNQEVYEECSWISMISSEVVMIKNFIMNHGMRLAMFNKFASLKLLSVAPTRFASVIVMLKRFKLIKRCLMSMVVSEEWDSYRDDDQEKAATVKSLLVNDSWWDSIDFILSFTVPIYDMLRLCDTDKPCLHLVYDMWDTIIEKVKIAIYAHEEKEIHESPSSFYEAVYGILISRWTKNNTSLHCLAHSLNPRYYSRIWLQEDSARVAPHKDAEISTLRIACLRKFFYTEVERSKVHFEFAQFTSMAGSFSDSDSIRGRYYMDPKSWWYTYGASAPMLQELAFKLLVQPSSSSCAERNWSSYSFVNSIRRNKLTTKRAEDLVFIHSNLRLLSRRSPQYMKGENRLWDIAGDNFGSFQDVGELEIAELLLDEPELESVIFEEGTEGNVDGGDQSHPLEI